MRTLSLVLLIALAGCASSESIELRTEPLTVVETEQVDALLEDLYGSFCYEAGEQPDWALMRSVFVEGAQFVSEPAAGEAPEPQSVDAFIASWRASIGERSSPTLATQEWIVDRRCTRAGELTHVDVVFQARKSGDPGPRRPGRDSLVLVRVGDAWKVLSFVVQYESKL